MSIRAGGSTQSTGGVIRLAPGGRAKPGTAGIATFSAATAVPSVILGTRLGGGAVPFLTHSSSARKSARKDRKSTRLNSSHEWISYAVFCLKKKKKMNDVKCDYERNKQKE